MRFGFLNSAKREGCCAGGGCGHAGRNRASGEQHSPAETACREGAMALNTADTLSPSARGHRAPPGVRSWHPCCREAGAPSPGPGGAWQPHRHREASRLPLAQQRERGASGPCSRRRPTVANPGTVGTARPRLHFHCQEQMFSVLNVRFGPPMQRISRSGTDAALLLSERPDI